MKRKLLTRFLLLLEREKTLAEGAGAAAIAALINRKTPFSGKKVAVLVCGGNIDVSLLSRIMERGLVKDGRLVRLRVHLPDYPGAFHRLTGILAQHRANIVETSYDRAYYGVNLGDTAIDITMETRGPDHIAELLSALSASGYTHERILSGNSHQIQPQSSTEVHRECLVNTKGQRTSVRNWTSLLLRYIDSIREPFRQIFNSRPCCHDLAHGLQSRA